MGISVLMSIYKKEKPEYFRETMESILAQTRQPEEIVLIEDGTRRGFRCRCGDRRISEEMFESEGLSTQRKSDVRQGTRRRSDTLLL